jgi:hypothetical protein
MPSPSSLDFDSFVLKMSSTASQRNGVSTHQHEFSEHRAALASAAGGPTRNPAHHGQARSRAFGLNPGHGHTDRVTTRGRLLFYNTRPLPYNTVFCDDWLHRHLSFCGRDIADDGSP